MTRKSEIEWTESTWNPVAGCSLVSPGCTNCYAMRMAARLQAMGMEKYVETTRKSGKRHVWTGRVNVDSKSLMAPVTWRKPQRIFVNSMSDLFQEALAEEFVRRIWQVMEQAHWHTFQVLTKRPERMLSLLNQPTFRVLSACVAWNVCRERGACWQNRSPAKNSSCHSLCLVRAPVGAHFQS